MWQNTFEFGPIDTPQSVELEIARRTLKMGALFCAVAALLFALIYAVGGPIEFAAPHVLASILLAIIAFVPARNPNGLLYLAVTIGLLLFGYQLLLLARVDNGISVWFLVPIIVAAMLGMRRMAVYCCAVSAVEIVGVVLAARLGALHPRVVVPNTDVIMVISIFAVATLAALFAYLTQRARARLVREVGTRNAALEDALRETHLARDQAIEAARAKERFFANLTHEIRTPLNGISGTAELLQHTALSPQQKPLAQALGASARNLVELVNAMLEHAKMSAGHMRVECAPVRLQNIARDLGDLFAARAAEKGLVFQVVLAADAPDWIHTDGLKLRQIAGNLIANAIKFTDSGSVRVKLYCSAPAGAGESVRLMVEIADSGSGIAPDMIDAVFEPFVQGDTSIDRTHGGTGLGLTIARRLAELLGGTLKVASVPGSGSTFTLELPVTPVEAPPQAAIAAPETAATARGTVPGAAGLRVLLAEDNSVNQLVACAMLESLKARVDVAENGMEAVEKADGGGYQLILMDLQMPIMDGIAAAREIRQREQSSGREPVPIIAMTGNSPDDYGSACVEAGMGGYLMKPVKLDQLRSILAELREAH